MDKFVDKRIHMVYDCYIEK